MCVPARSGQTTFLPADAVDGGAEFTAPTAMVGAELAAAALARANHYGTQECQMVLARMARHDQHDGARWAGSLPREHEDLRTWAQSLPGATVAHRHHAGEPRTAKCDTHHAGLTALLGGMKPPCCMVTNEAAPMERARSQEDQQDRHDEDACARWAGNTPREVWGLHEGERITE